MEKITKGEKSKQRIIEVSARLFIKNGYNNTGIKEILEETNLPKGSFYYHFKNKKDLAMEVAEFYKKEMGRWLLSISINKNWLEFSDKLIDDIKAAANKDEYFGCPFAVLSTEMAFIEPEILKYFSTPLENLIKIFSSVLEKSNVKGHELEIKAQKAFALFEGYVMYYRATKDVNVLENLRLQLKNIWYTFYY